MSFLKKKQVKNKINKIVQGRSTIVIRDYKLSDSTVMRLVDNDGIKPRYSVSFRVIDDEGLIVGMSDIEDIKKDFYDRLSKIHARDLITEETYHL